MLVLRLLLLTLLAAPQQRPSFRDAAADFLAAFNARDPVRVTPFWSATVPEHDPQRTRLVFLALAPGARTVTPTFDDAGRVLRIDLRDSGGVLYEQYDVTFVEEEGAWRVASFQAAPTDAPVPRARELLYRGNALIDRGDIDAALDAFTKAAELADLARHASTRAFAQQTLGNVYRLRGDLATATRHYEQSLAIAREANHPANAGRALDRLATLDAMAGNLDRAESRLTEALALFRQADDRLLEAYMLNALGTIRSTRSDYQRSNALYADALAIFEELGNKAGMSTQLINLGVNARHLGQYRRSVDMLTRALALSRAVDDPSGMAHAQTNLGIVLAMQGNLTDAMQAHQEALRLHERLGRTDAIVVSLADVGEMYRTLGDVEQARAHFERSLAMAEKLGYRRAIADALHHLARLRRDGGDARGAIALYEKALAIHTELGDRAMIARGTHNLGRAHLLAGDRVAARGAFEKSLAIAEEIGAADAVAVSLAMLGQVAEDVDEAIAHSRRAVALANGLGLAEQRWQSHLGLGLALQRGRRTSEARAEIERAVAIVEELRRDVPGAEVAQQQAFENLLDPYRALIALLVQQGDAAAAFEYAERAKARVLLDVLQNGRPDFAGALTEEERAREAALAAEVAQVNREHRAALLAGKASPALTARVREARLAYDAFLAAAYAAHPQLREQRGEVTPLRAGDVDALLAGGAADAFLEFVVADERTYLFTITRDGLRVHTIATPKAQLEREVRRFRELVAAHDLTYAGAARALYARLLRPVEAQLRGAKTICIVPDGPLWELPFQALQPSANEFLLDRHALYSVPSLTVLREISSRAPKRAGAARLLAVGNPVLRRGGGTSVWRDAALEPLPHAETEVRAIAALYGARNSRVHLRAEAREEVVKGESGAYDVLHFATHGVLDDQNALYSRLVFSPPQSASEDGLLEAREIMRLDLQASLAVLSACETARGRVSSGEGVIGMSWALFVAGVPATIVSQWKVDSASTAELMIELHRNLRVPGRTKAEALRRAALKTRAKHPHPFYWAPFVVVGR